MVSGKCITGWGGVGKGGNGGREGWAMDRYPVQGEIETFPVLYTTETRSDSHSMSSSTKTRVK